MAQFRPTTDGLPIAPPPPKGTLDFNSRAPLDPVWPPMTPPINEIHSPTAAPVPDIALQGGPLVRYDGHVREITRYQQSGKVELNGDTITQQIGRVTAEYSLSQLAAHSNDRELFEATIRYAAEHGDSVKIDVHGGVARVNDPTFDRKILFDIPLREPILQAAMKNGVDPAYLASLGVQETHLGTNYLGATTG